MAKALRPKSVSPDGRLPGPKQLIMLGNLLDFKDQPLRKIQELTEQYGPVFKLKMLNEHWVVISDYKLLREVMISKGAAFTGKPTGFRMSYMWEVVGLPGAVDLNPETKQMREVMTKVLRTYSEGNRAMEEITGRVLHQFTEKISGMSGDAFCPLQQLQRLTAGLMSCLILNKDEPDFIDNILCLTESVMHVFLSAGGLILDLAPWTRMLNTAASKHLRNVRETSDYLYNSNKPDMEISNAENNQNQSCIQSLMSALHQKNGVVDDRKVRGIIAAIIVGGTDSTTNVLMYILCVCAHYPHIQRHIQEELDQVIGTRSPRREDRAHCHYTRAAILEVLRNTVAAVLKAPRKAVKDTELAGYQIPAGTIIMLNGWAVHHDPEVFSDPYEYKPDRYLDQEGHLLSPDHPVRQFTMPFSAGPRICPGQAFAVDRLFLITCHLLQKFIVKPEDNVDADLVHPLRIISKDMKLKFHERV